jgi:N-hydroxyarylamine O-acetyltransferase
VDLDAYFARIGWTGPRTPTPDILAGILAHHMETIPFENLDVLLGRPPRLDLPSLEAKLVGARRGGYCYEHTTLFAAALRELGFEVALHSARVILFTPRGESPRTHMFCSVGDVVLDPGFGGLAPRLPVPRDGSAAGQHRFIRDGIDTVLVHGEQRLWVSSFERDIPIDFEMANHFTATHPSSPFTRGLMMRAFIPGGEVRIRGRDLTITKDGHEQKRPVADRRELRAFVVEHFGFDLPEIETMRVPLIPEWT